MRVYYNEWDKDCCAWLRELMKAGLIAEGEIDSRSIYDVKADDVRGFDQRHWFAGIGGWAYAIRLAGFNGPCDTVSSPCQGFSPAGRQKGTSDHRDLWPAYSGIARELHPPTIVGEQVERAIAHGWLDRLCDDLEAEGYAVGATVLPACSIEEANHIRPRLWWVAHSQRKRQQGQGQRCRPLYPTPYPFGEASGIVDAVRWGALPFLCGRHHGVSRNVGRIANHGFGNAIVPQVAAEFIMAYADSVPGIAFSRT